MTIDLHQMKNRLEAKRDELRTNISGLTEAHPVPTDSIEVGDGPNDFEDKAVDFLELQKEQSLLVNEQALLTEVLRALKRIDEGTYGLCVTCGNPIPEKRLEAIPWAARDVQCEQALEQRNLGREEIYEERSY
ncbi:MAG: TraR/DksA family transcriptional regulator [Ktedonobacteraceae bacterium]